MLRQAHEIGLGVGDFFTAILNGIHYLQKALIAGTNLEVLKKEADYQARLIARHSQGKESMPLGHLPSFIINLTCCICLLAMSQTYMKKFQDTINFLINKDNVQGEEGEDDEASGTDFAESVLYHKITR